MNPPVPPFDPMGLPLPSPILSAFAYLTLTLHFVAMQFTVGAALLLLLSWRKQPGIARFFANGLPLGFSYLVTFGIPPLLFVQVIYGQFFYSSSVLIGAYWISVIPLVIIGYGAAYWHKLSRDTRPSCQLVLIAATAAVLLAVGYVYVNNITLSLRPERWLGHYQHDPGGGALNYGEPTRLGRYGLFIVPGLTVLVAATNGQHHAVWTDITINPTSYVATYGHGAWFWIFMAFTYAVLALGVASLLSAWFHFPAHYRSQTGVR